MCAVATTFVLRAIQDWGQSEAERIAATQAVLDAAGFKATAACGPVFGGIWPKPCTGPDAERAMEWLQKLTDQMPRGRFQDEEAHVAERIKAAKATAAANH